MSNKRFGNNKDIKTSTEKDPEFSDLINKETIFAWDKLVQELPEESTEGLIEIMLQLKLYVNKPFALELAKRDDAVFWLRRMLQHGRNWYFDDSGNGWAPIHAVHILSLIKTKEAFELLLDIIRYRGEDLSDWLTESVSSLLYAFGEDVIDSLIEFTEDETLEPFARGTGTTALAALAREYPKYSERVKKHIIKLLNSTEDYTFATLIIDDLASFRDPSVMPEINKAFEEDKIDEFLMTKRDIEMIIDGEFVRQYERHTEDPMNYFSRDNIEYLHSLHYDKSKKTKTGLKMSKKIGRNDPCPCGSGKKYKKCCLGKELEIIS
jgi:hypothetical protein